MFSEASGGYHDHLACRRLHGHWSMLGRRSGFRSMLPFRDAGDLVSHRAAARERRATPSRRVRSVTSDQKEASGVCRAFF